MTPTLQPIIDNLEQQRLQHLDNASRLALAIKVLKGEQSVIGSLLRPSSVLLPAVQLQAQEPQPQGPDINQMSLEEVKAYWHELHPKAPPPGPVQPPQEETLPQADFASMEEAPSEQESEQQGYEELASDEAPSAPFNPYKMTPLVPKPQDVEKICPKCGPMMVAPDRKRCRCHTFFQGETRQNHQAEAVAQMEGDLPDPEQLPVVPHKRPDRQGKPVIVQRVCSNCGPVQLHPAKKRCTCGELVVRNSTPLAERQLPPGVVKEDGVVVSKLQAKGSYAERVRSTPFT